MFGFQFFCSEKTQNIESIKFREKQASGYSYTIREASIKCRSFRWRLFFFYLMLNRTFVLISAKLD